MPQLAFVAAVLPLGGIPPTTLPTPTPPWPATYDMKASTIAMPCNYTGYTDARMTDGFGLISYDWSNAKQLWANTKPMDAERRMVEQAAITKGRNAEAHVWVYRNLVKALPWLGSVREKLLDPAYASWFLKFDPKRAGNYHVPDCDSTYSPPLCSEFYHDQEQTPRHGGSVESGDCEGLCDCGASGGLPCGEYLFDHRNGTMLQEWLVNEYIVGANGVGNPNISGVFIDDFWCYGSKPGECTDPVQGGSEIDRHQQVDMGLSDEDIREISLGWRRNMDAVQRALLARGAYAWDLFPNQHNAGCGAAPYVTQSNCKKVLASQCKEHPVPNWRGGPLYYGLTVDKSKLNSSAEARLPQLHQDLASFLLVRGDYAWIGYGFVGCAADVNYTQPELLREDYGEPAGACHPVAGSDAVFRREYSKAIVEVDCGKWQGIIIPK